MNDITYSPGAYAWLKCASGVQCADQLMQLAGTDGRTAGMNMRKTIYVASRQAINVDSISGNEYADNKIFQSLSII